MNHPLLVKGVDEFNKGEFYDAHETLEDYWNTLQGDEKELVQSIIQAAVAYYHFGRDNRVGARKLMLRAVARAESVPEGTLGIETRPYLEAIKQSLQVIESGDASSEMPIAEIRFKS